MKTDGLGDEGNVTKLLVLGLLEQGMMSGYELQQKISRADAERWGGVLPGSVYHALKKLEQEGYVELAAMEQTGHRQKAVYQITEQGKAYLKTLVFDSLRASSVLYPTTLYSALSLIERIPQAEAVKALAEQKEQLDREYAALEQGQRSNEQTGQKVSPMGQITIDHMMAVIQLQQQFVNTILETLQEDRP